MILCVDQGGTSHIVYEVEEPAWGGIGALTQVDHQQARSYAQRLIDEGHMTAGPYRIALYGDSPEPLDQAPVEAASRGPHQFQTRFEPVAL
jgi:hypothetical protein